MRLLTDAAFIEEFDIVVDEISAAYVAGQFTGEEREQVENYFLRSPERLKKVRFMAELLHQVSAARDEPADVPQEKKPSFAERLRAFFTSPGLMPRFATVAIAVLLLGGGALWLSRSGGPITAKFVALTVPISDAERGAQDQTAQPPSIKLPADVNELRLELLLPSQQTQTVKYRADFAAPAKVQGLTIVGQDSRAVVIAVPASELKPDRYAVQLFMIRPDGQDDRVPGTYFFRIE